jgi:ACS family hexuronate transporter-like MFS transporter
VSCLVRQMKTDSLFSPSHAHYNWFVVSLLWTSHVIYFSTYNSLGVLGPLIKQEFALSNTYFGLLFSFIFIGSMIIQIPAGIWCDRVGVRRMISWGLLLVGVSILFFSLNRSLIFAYVILSCLGLGMASSQISAVKSILDWFAFRGRATAMGIKQTGINMGGILTSLLLPALVVRYPWRLVMGSIGLIALAFALLFFFLYRDSSETDNLSDRKEFHVRHILILLGTKDFLIVTLSGIFLMAVQFSFSSYLVLYLNNELHYSLESSGILLALSFGTGALARVGWGLVSDYLCRDRKSILVVIGVVGTLVSILFSLATSSSPSWVIYLLSICFGLTGMGWNAVFLTIVGELSSRETAGLGIGFSFFAINIGVLLGPPFFGLLVDLFSSFVWAWLFLAFCMSMVSLLILWTMNKSRKDPAVSFCETDSQDLGSSQEARSNRQ